MAECTSKIGQKSIGDLKTGLGYFARFPKTLFCAGKSASPIQTQTFIEEIKQPKTVADITKLESDLTDDYSVTNYLKTTS
jgi:type IV secretory pathway VirB10-like protein